MEGQSRLSELSVISWVSAIQGCPLSGVPLYNNISQESRIFELAFFSMIVEITYIQDIKHEMGSVHSSHDLGIP